MSKRQDIFITCSLLWAIPLCGMAQKLRIAVAANAQFVTQVLAKEYEKQTGVRPELIINSSGKITAQIEHGAPFDIFMSADMQYPMQLYNKKLSTAKPKVYAYGALVLWTQKNIKADVTALTQPGIKKIAIANPQLAPYGVAAIEALKKLNLYNILQYKLVYGQSIAQVNQYWLTGAAEAVFTAKAIVLDPAQSGKGNWHEIDAQLYQPIAQGVVITKASTGESLVQAQKFYRFLFSNVAREIFKKYGYR